MLETDLDSAGVATGVDMAGEADALILQRSRQTGNMMQLDDLLALETAVWTALQVGDADADQRSLSEDFLGVYPSGFANRSDHVGQLANGPTIAKFSILHPRMMVVSETNFVLSYRADFTRSGSDRVLESMYVSSLWSLRDGRWVNTFSQDTPTSPNMSAGPETPAS